MSHFKYLSIFLAVLLVNTQHRIDCFQEDIKETGYTCSGSYAILECPSDYMIIVSSITHKYTPSQCADSITEFGGKGTPSLDKCIGIDKNDAKLSSACNGQETCHYQIEKKDQKLGHYGTNCDFESNIANINYVCIPNRINESFKSFDICDSNGPDTILGLENGFIHSPSFPEYYGNNRFCYVNIGIPEGKRIVLYLLIKSLEGLGFFDKKPTDYLIIDNEYEIYGTSNTPYILYNSTNKDKVQIKFKSDWITSSQLRNPKGFLIYFEVSSVQKSTKATTTLPSSTTTTTTTIATTIESVNNTLNNTDSLKEELIFRQHLISQKMKNEREMQNQENDQIVTIVSTLVALIGLLVLTIFGLLLLFRKKQTQQNDDIYHDVNDEKSIANSSNTYNEDYQNASNINDDSPSSNRKNNSDNQKNNSSTNTPSKFNTRLKNFYKQLNQNLMISNRLLAKCNQKTMNSNRLDADESILNTPTKSFNINEFNPNDIDVKFEKDIPIDKLKLFKVSSTNTKSAASLFKKSNLDHEKELINRLENTYVSNPTDLNENASSKKLQIYEVNFENNFAYITPSLESKSSNSILMTPPPRPTVSDQSTALNKGQNEDTEIYQSISDPDDEQESSDDLNELIVNDQLKINNEQANESISHDQSYFNETIDSTKEMLAKNNELIYNTQSIYNVPTNKRCEPIKKMNDESFGDENNGLSSSMQNQNSSIIRLLNDNDNETQA